MAYVYERFRTKKEVTAYCEKRNLALYNFSLRGWTQKELAEKYHLTTQRVGQIIQAQERLARKTRRKAS